MARGPLLTARDATKRGLCQSVCSSAICRTPRRKPELREHCRASANPLRLSCPSTGRPAGRAASPSSTTPIAPSPKRRSADSTSSRSRGGRWRSAKRGRGRSAPAGAPRPGGFAAPAPGGSGRRKFRRLRAAGRAAGHPAPADSAAARTVGPAQPELRPRRAAEEQAQGRRARTRDRGPKGPIKERPVSRLYENDEDWRNEKPDEDIDDVATSAKADADLDGTDEE